MCIFYRSHYWSTEPHVQYKSEVRRAEIKNDKNQKRNESLAGADDGEKTMREKERKGEESEHLNGFITVSCCYFHF